MTLDWQTVVVTVVALCAAGVIVRRFLPAKRKPGAAPAAACEHCETGAKAMAAPDGSTARTQTTAVVSVADLRGSAAVRDPRRGSR